MKQVFRTIETGSPGKLFVVISQACLAWVLAICVLLIDGKSCAAAVPQDDVVDQPRIGRLVKVRLPIDDNVKREVRSALENIIESVPLTVRPDGRPVVVLEFETASGKTGRGSELEACQSLARTLMDRRFNPIETIAYVPAAETFDSVANPLENDGVTRLTGHAVLVALAANQLAMAPNTAIGDAGVDEPVVDELLSTIYRTLTANRGRLPASAVASMLDPSVGLTRVVKKGDQATYVNAADLKLIEAKEILEDTETLAAVGKRAVLTADQLQRWGLINLFPENRSALELALRLKADVLKDQLFAGRDWKAIHLPLPVSVDEKAERWIIKTLNRKMAEGVNLVIVTIDDSVGDVQGCLAVARQLAELRRQDVQTVAFVRGNARGPVGLVALACDHLILSPTSKLGGYEEGGEEQVDKSELDEVRPAIQQLATAVEKDWSIMMAMLDPGLVVTRYKDTQRSGQVRLMTDEEAESLGEGLARWKPQDVLSVSSGLNASTADRFGLTRLVAEDMGQLQTFYQLEAAPETVELSASERMVDRIATFFRRPVIGLFLLMGAFFFISNEIAAPGLGVPGFLGTMCLVLYFWCHWFGGETGVFEILMFILGVVFIGLEVFVIPGFGVFGIGGICLVLASIVLAAQDSFIIPTNGKQLAQLPYSLMPIVGAGLGFVLGVVFLQKAFETSPFLRRFMLQVPDREVTGLNDRDPEATASWEHLLDETGTVVTRCIPAGKARINGRVYDVISTGQAIDKGQQVVVVEAIANRVVIKAVEAA
jgi:membrane-bound ClpP family serine protease